jgi:hypothetical protein
MNAVHKPSLEELSPYYQSYLKYIPEEDILDALVKQAGITDLFLKSIGEDRASLAYAVGKWKLKEVAGHLNDTERILSYRALRISRNDKTPLPGFDENTYTPNSNYGSITLVNIAREKKVIRESTIALFTNMSMEMFDRKGITNNTEVSVRAILFFIVAHERHHLQVIKERYLS